MTADPMLAITAHVRAGEDLLLRLKSARERDAIAKYVRALRRWHHELQPLVEAYSVPLAESLRILNPRPEEYQRVAGDYQGLAQPRLLMTTATVLYRLAPHLANAKPVRRQGRKKGTVLDDSEAVAKARELVKEGVSNRQAALQAVALGLADPKGYSDDANFWRVYRQI